MISNLPQAPASYVPEDQRQLRSLIEQNIKNCRQSDEDVELSRNQRLIIRDDVTGSRYRLHIVSGVITLTAMPT